MLLKMVIRSNDDTSLYLTKSKEWTLKRDVAWEYTTDLVFPHAADHAGSVYLRLPGGREIEVSKEDFIQ